MTVATRHAADEAPAAVPPPPALPIDPRNVLKWALLGGLTAVFVAAIGAVESFDERNLIDPILGLGYAAVLWIPIAFGYRAALQPSVEGLPAPRRGIGNVVAAALAGLVAGGALAAFMLFIDAFDVRDILLNASPRLVELLSFEQSLGFGAVAWLAVGAGLGAVGGLLYVLPVRLRAAVKAAVLWTVIISFTELILGQVLNELGLGAVSDFLFTDARDLGWRGAAIVAVGAFSISLLLGGRTSGWRARAAALPEPRRKRLVTVATIGFVALGFVLPLIFGSFLNEIMATVGLFLLMGLGLNIVIGYAGLLDLGYVAFFAVGAYVMAILTSAGSPRFSPELSFWAALPFVIIAATIAGIVVGTPVIRMRGDYLAIVTLGFGEIARILFLSDWFKSTFGGAQGILQIPPILVSRGFVQVSLVVIMVGLLAYLAWWLVRSPSGAAPSPGPGAVAAPPDSADRTWRIVGIAAAILVAAVALQQVSGDEGPIEFLGINTQAFFYLILAFVLFAAYVSWRLQDSRIGRAWMAMREDEQVAEAIGINTVTAKLMAFVAGAIIASLGGALFAAKVGSVFPSSFALIVSIIVLVLIIVGGMGNIPGVAVGALVLVGILGGPRSPGLLREFETYKLLIYGALLVYMMLQRPEGLLPSRRRAQELHQAEYLQDAWLKTEAPADSTAPAESG